MTDDKKVEAYLEMDWNYLNDEPPIFTLSINSDNVSFKVIDISESEVRELMKDIEDMLSLYLEVVNENISIKSDIKRIPE